MLNGKVAVVTGASRGIGRQSAISMAKEGAVVIDVGLNRLENKKLVGDVAFSEAAEKAAAITPVPGGVGSVTTSVLVGHVVEAAMRKNS